MASPELTFGYYPRSLDVAAGAVTIATLPDLEQTVAAIDADSQVDDGWIYAPPQRVKQLGGGVYERPYSARVFGLPKTHRLRHAAPDGPDHLNFHLWVLSFFLGTRLTSAEAGFVDATPITPGKLVDFVLLGQTLPRSIEVAETFWTTHRADPHRARLVAAAVHALYLAQNPLLLQFRALPALLHRVRRLLRARQVGPRAQGARPPRRPGRVDVRPVRNGGPRLGGPRPGVRAGNRPTP